MKRTFVSELSTSHEGEVLLRGWILRQRALAKTTFLLLQDCTGSIQCVADPELTRGLALHADDAVEIRGTIRRDDRAPSGFEVDIVEVTPLNRVAPQLPFTAASDLSGHAIDMLLDHRPLSLRNEAVGDIFRIQATILRTYREFLTEKHFTEIVSSKIVGGGTEGGTHLFEIKYFDRAAYLAQSPQFYKEHGVAGFERVFETGHVYRAEPHATSRHLTEYYSLDLEMGFIDGVEDVIQLERELLTYIFNEINELFGARLESRGMPTLPSMLDVPVWTFDEALARLRDRVGRTDLVDDLDPSAERQLCDLADEENGIPAVFVVGFPLASRPFYTHPRGDSGAAESFDLLFRGLEITTGGQRLHKRDDLERAISARGIDPASFEPHLRMFDLGMPPHGGLAIGLERLTMLICGLSNVREATLYPRDRFRVSP
jgi:nondiscriminating aspartyl-tRNA synthetase